MADALPADAVAKLRARYAIRLTATTNELAQLCQVPVSEAVDMAIVHLVHQISGSAASFGHPNLSALARSVEGIWTDEQDSTKLRDGARAIVAMINTATSL